MKLPEQVEDEISEKEDMAEKSDEMEKRVRPYIQALEWVLEGEAEEKARLGLSNHDPHFDEIIFGGRTGERKIVPQMKSDDSGVYVVLRIDKKELITYN